MLQKHFLILSKQVLVLSYRVITFSSGSEFRERTRENSNRIKKGRWSVFVLCLKKQSKNSSDWKEKEIENQKTEFILML